MTVVRATKCAHPDSAIPGRETRPMNPPHSLTNMPVASIPDTGVTWSIQHERGAQPNVDEVKEGDSIPNPLDFCKKGSPRPDRLGCEFLRHQDPIPSPVPPCGYPLGPRGGHRVQAALVPAAPERLPVAVPAPADVRHADDPGRVAVRFRAGAAAAEAVVVEGPAGGEAGGGDADAEFYGGEFGRVDVVPWGLGFRGGDG